MSRSAHFGEANASPPTATATRWVQGEEPKPAPTAEADQPITPIEELSRGFGEPPDATLGRLRIPARRRRALGVRTVGADARCSTPRVHPTSSGTTSPRAGSHGGEIGGGGNAVFSAHADYADAVPWAGVVFRRRGVFFSPSLLWPEDVIEIEVGGERLRYAVQREKQVDASDTGAWADMLSADVEQDSISIITCGRQFNTATRSYLDRTVARAIRS